jgi:two-component system sensor histidine kinase YesM
MLLQPLLENAIFHGAKELDRKLSIVISAKRTDDGRMLVLEMMDDGAGFQTDFPISDSGGDVQSQHIGLRNVQDRIRLRFGEEYGLMAERRGEWTCITLHMPFRLIEGESEGNVEHAYG